MSTNHTNARRVNCNLSQDRFRRRYEEAELMQNVHVKSTIPFRSDFDLSERAVV